MRGSVCLKHMDVGACQTHTLYCVGAVQHQRASTYTPYLPHLCWGDALRARTGAWSRACACRVLAVCEPHTGCPQLPSRAHEAGQPPAAHSSAGPVLLASCRACCSNDLTLPMSSAEPHVCSLLRYILKGAAAGAARAADSAAPRQLRLAARRIHLHCSRQRIARRVALAVFGLHKPGQQAHSSCHCTSAEGQLPCTPPAGLRACAEMTLRSRRPRPVRRKAEGSPACKAALGGKPGSTVGSAGSRTLTCTP